MSIRSSHNSQTTKTPQQWFNATAIVEILLVGLLFLAYLVTDRDSIIDNGKQMAERIAAHTALIAEGVLDSAQHLLFAMDLLVQPPLQGRSLGAPSIRRSLQSLRARNPQIMDLLIISGNGVIKHWTGEGEPPNISDRDYFSYHLGSADKGLFVGKPLLSKVHAGRWFFALSEAARDELGNLQYVMVAIVDEARFKHFINDELVVKGSSRAILSNDGQFYTRSPYHEEFVGSYLKNLDDLKLVSPQNSPIIRIRASQLDSEERILVFRQVNRFPLVAVGSVLLDELLVAWKQRMVFLVLAWLLLSIAIIWVAHRAKSISRIQRELASLDSLTGINNRGAIMSTALNLERSQDHAGQLSLLMIDVDHFKSINDQFGHLAGDEVLRRISKILRNEIRYTDIVGRYGGEEFLVLMPDTGTDGAMLLAEKLRCTVEEQMVQPVQVTVSVGIATTSENDLSLDQTLSRADKALYQAKANGRNCVKAG